MEKTFKTGDIVMFSNINFFEARFMVNRVLDDVIECIWVCKGDIKLLLLHISLLKQCVK
jgi:hypothetical protein